ncbi:MAG: alcohol dehydrogenase catalytic domain-containing protein, partial [Chloroflexota bacterium]|nr:alcohol dehydrogenase catalytic domain-containing protein [Chloroflexota bacterium]
MRAVTLEGPGAVRLVDVPPPDLEPGQALVQLRLAGICGSDLAAYRGTSPLVQYPRVLGHELLVDVLQSPDRPELEGNRAVVEPLLRCGRCRACRLGRYNCCMNLRVLGVHVDGGLQDQFRVESRNLFPVPEGMLDEVAVLAEPTSIAYHAVERSGIGTGRLAVVFGAGSIGLLIAQLLRARNCHVYVIDINPFRLEVAQALGAIAVHGDEQDPVRVVAEATGGEMADAVFEATGNPACTRLTTGLAGHA